MSAPDPDLLRKARAYRSLAVREARVDAARFVEYAFRHELTGARLVNAPFHLEWHAFLSNHDRAVVVAPVEHAKTQHVAVGRVLHEIGKNRNIRAAIISNTADQAKKVLRAIRTHIESNPRVAEVFPDLKPSTRTEDPWGSDAITVERDTISKDATLQALGAHGAIVGSRLDLIVIDDILDYENTATEAQRKKLLEWLETSVLTRATEGASIWFIGTPWADGDLIEELTARPGWAVLRHAAVHNPDDHHDSWVPLWPQQWSLERLLKTRAGMLDHVFARKYLTRIRHSLTARFRAEWLMRMVTLGRGRQMLPHAPLAHGSMRPLPCFTGVDLGVGDGEDSALTCLFTLAMEAHRLVVVDIQSGHWTSPEIIDRLHRVYLSYGSTIAVESNGAQRFLIQQAGEHFPVHGLHTGVNKHDEEWGVESLAIEIRGGIWVLPSGPDGRSLTTEARAWIGELSAYRPSAHTGDRVMASWIAREAARKLGGGFVRQIDTQLR